MATNKKTQDVSAIFLETGINAKVIITATDNTYEIDTKNPKDNWLYPAFLGFKKLKEKLNSENKKVKTFATIGTGQGIDAVGAQYAFNAQEIILTDIHPKVVSVAQQNFINNSPLPLPRFKTFIGNLCEPLNKNKIIADIIYTNLPNIPLDGSETPFTGQLTSTFFDTSWIQKTTHQLEKYLLSLQNAFLFSASKSLIPGGSVIINLGGRVPLWIIKKMFTDAGYHYQELFNMFKLQTQPEWVLGGYARAEEKYKVNFDFYRFDIAQQKLNKQFDNQNISAAQLKQILKPFRVNATEALKLYIYKHERIGHTVQLIRGIKKTPA